MDPLSGFVLDPSKCRKLNIKQKRGLIREISKWPEAASEKLQSWSRKDLLEILCAEMGKDRKYPGMTKPKMIDQLFRVVSANKLPQNLPEPSSESSGEDTEVAPAQKASKRQRKSDCPSRLAIEKVSMREVGNKNISRVVCENIACSGVITEGDDFCKKCICCVCRNYDENRDPSLWIFCGFCGVAFHAACVISRRNLYFGFCVTCRKEIDLLACWKKQLTIAKKARRLDVLYQRISLSHQLLNSTEKYKPLHDIVDIALKKLDTELGTGTDISEPVPILGFVEKISAGTEVQRLCILALDLATENDNTGSGTNGKTTNSELSNNSSYIDHESNANHNNNNTNNKINNGIIPFTDINETPDSPNSLKISDMNQSGSGLDEEPNSQRDSTNSMLPLQNGILGSKENDFEYCVKVVRWLECEGYVASNFRVKFLTWFSLRASVQERRVVRVYVEPLIDDPVSLARQLADTFSEADVGKRSQVVSSGLCMELWH